MDTEQPVPTDTSAGSNDSYSSEAHGAPPPDGGANLNGADEASVLSNPNTAAANEPDANVAEPGNPQSASVKEPGSEESSIAQGAAHPAAPLKISAMVNSEPSPSLSHQSSTASAQSMQLNDAFAYLDKVRREFADQPEVYNKFLQVMREFKANTIDANGVIMRVVQLFKGHRNLILGFNAFLPKTHHIDPNIQDFSRWAQSLSGVASMGQTGQPETQPAGPAYAQPQPPASASSQFYAAQSSAMGAGAGVASAASTSTAAAGNASSAAPTIPAAGPSPAVVRGANSPQFIRAVGFVEKIKQRFASEPDVYRAFLGILHSFHRDQKGAKEVYAQVQQLFKLEPDLLAEFTQFLPDHNAPGSAIAQQQQLPSQQQQPAQQSAQQQRGQLPPVGRFPHPVQSQTASNKRPSSALAASQVVSSGLEKPKRARPFEGYAITKTEDEADFFGKVKRYLNNRQVYAEFLKCLSLFSQDILKLPELIAMVRNFIGGNEELFVWFKRYLNYQEESANRGDGGGQAHAHAHAHTQMPELNLAALKRIGSYRLLPRGYQPCRASGRTLLCDEVLSDGMVSCPSFESEDSGFVSSKKNQYEDVLFKCEDERFEMDLLLEYNQATIAVLDPIARRLEAMAPAEREALRLNAKLNAASEIIYKKAIKRVYGEKGDEVYDYLQRAPAAAVPVVLRRLKQKDEEWRRAQRDWNRVWAEIHIKNYYKALDHQGIDFKQTDRRTLTLRSLVQEVQTIKEERRRWTSGTRAEGVLSTPHLSLVLGDESLLQDVLRLVFTGIRTSPSLSGADRRSLTRFFSTFVPEFFKVELPADVREGLEGLLPRGHHTLSANVAGRTEPIPDNADANASGVDEQDALKPTTSAAPAPGPVSSSMPMSLVLYANDGLFGFVRLFMIAYERLERMKQAAVASHNEPFVKEKQNVVAGFLDLRSRQPTMTVDDEIAGGQRDFYGVLMVLLEQMLAGDMEPGLFEEKVRYMFGTSGYLVFTFDRLILTLLRQCLGVLNDGACESLIRLYDSWKLKRGVSGKASEYSLRLAAENIVFDGGNGAASGASPNLFRVEWDGGKRGLVLHLLDRLPASASGAAGGSSVAVSVEEKWSAYVDNFVRLEANPAFLSTATSRVFLGRTRRTAEGPAASEGAGFLVHYNLECKICINTYKLFYVENTEDFLCSGHRTRTPREAESGVARRQRLLRVLRLQD